MGFEEVTDVRIKPHDVSFISMILVENIIVEIGNHESLIKKEGFYYQLVASQAGKLKEDLSLFFYTPLFFIARRVWRSTLSTTRPMPK